MTIGDTDGHEPIITVDDSNTIHWADNDYVLVINGNVIDRGPDNKTALEMVLRLISELPTVVFSITLATTRCRSWYPQYSVGVIHTHMRWLNPTVNRSSIVLLREG
ncbi:hypothetical protein [Halonotius pteroides]|uniref:hypothetical protein n=1 Tax=Halonotius pteroides TaxID=268735 RepID=UPI00374326B1